MSLSNFKKGDILRATDTSKDAGFHPIVYWSENSGADDFLGLMITHSSEKDNIKLSAEHIKKCDASGNIYEFQFDKSYLVKGIFYKPEVWGPFTKTGEATDEGITFFEENLQGVTFQKFSDYLRSAEPYYTK